jgi:hypothetical protein
MMAMMLMCFVMDECEAAVVPRARAPRPALCFCVNERRRSQVERVRSIHDRASRVVNQGEFVGGLAAGST